MSFVRRIAFRQNNRRHRTEHARIFGGVDVAEKAVVAAVLSRTKEHLRVMTRASTTKAMTKRALVTGGAGLIGSHVTDLLVREGCKVRVLDNLEPQTHRRGKPAWINEKAEFIEGDLRDRDTITAALGQIDIVFHQAAYGGFMPEITKFVHVNSLGTAQMLEVIREKSLPI